MKSLTVSAEKKIFDYILSNKKDCSLSFNEETISISRSWLWGMIRLSPKEIEVPYFSFLSKDAYVFVYRDKIRFKSHTFLCSSWLFDKIVEENQKTIELKKEEEFNSFFQRFGIHQSLYR